MARAAAERAEADRPSGTQLESYSAYRKRQVAEETAEAEAKARQQARDEFYMEVMMIEEKQLAREEAEAGGLGSIEESPVEIHGGRRRVRRQDTAVNLEAINPDVSVSLQNIFEPRSRVMSIGLTPEAPSIH